MSQGQIRIAGAGLFGVYFFLLLLFLWPLVDLLSNTWPLQLGNIQWRVGFMGLLTAYLHTPMLAVFLAMVFAFLFNHKLTVRLLSLLFLLGALLLATGMAFFALDAIQLRSGIPAENQSSFSTGTILSELKFLTALVAAALLGWGGWVTGATMPGKPKTGEGSGLTAEVLKAQKRA